MSRPFPAQAKWLEGAAEKAKRYGEFGVMVGSFEPLQSLDFPVMMPNPLELLPEPTRSWMRHFRARAVDTPLRLARGRKRVIQRRFNVDVLEASFERNASTLRVRPER